MSSARCGSRGWCVTPRGARVCFRSHRPRIMEARKLAEAEALMAAAAKCTKTGFFSKWKADWEGAAAEYEKAATSFRVAKALPRAVEAFVKASEAHANFDSDYMAAKHLESGALILRDNLKQADRAATLWERACTLHQEGDRLPSAVEDLVKAARALEGADAARSAELAQSACKLIDDEDDEGKLRQCVETYKLAVALLLRAKRFADAAPALRQQAAIHARLQQPHNVARCELSALTASLAADAFDEALSGYEGALGRGDGFAGSDEAAMGERVLNAYTSQSEEELAACVADQVFTFLENQVALVARSLTLRSLSRLPPGAPAARRPPAPAPAPTHAARGA